ncbi:MAG: hypothetical protein WBV94_14235 [Blastocatellia bacterium]
MAAQPRTIIQKLAGIPARIANEPGFDELLKARSLSAILGGPTSADWRAYMMLIISNNPDSPQLRRVTDLNTVPPPTADVLTSSAYMVANGACGAATGGQTGFGVKASIDDDLAPEP